MANSKHFVLVHGMCHGAWCWYKVVAMLKAAGHRVTPLDLAACGINPKKLSDLSSFSNYEQPLIDFMASLPENEKVILVGHSFGGLGISLAMENFPDKVLVGVYLTSFMPNFKSPPSVIVQEYLKRNSHLDFTFSYDDGPEKPPTSAIFGPKGMIENLYQLCPPEDVELAKAVVRPSKLFLGDLSKTSIFTEKKYGSVDRIFVLAQADELLKPDFQEWVIKENPPKEVEYIAKADHMPMLSTPKELSNILRNIAKNVSPQSI